VLTQDARSSTVDTLDEGWAQPIVGMPIERAVVAGAITDEQGKFNLNNLSSSTTPTDVRVFRSLLAAAGLPAELVDAVSNWTSQGGEDDSYYLSLARPYRAANRLMVQVDELYRVRGFDAAAVAKLRPYVTALPEHTPINVNTVPAPMLAALVGDAPEALRAIAALRAKGPFKKIADFQKLVPGVDLGNAIDVQSRYFGVRVQVAQDDVQLATDALVQRSLTDPPVIIWRRPRF
jgi:general secretion pathway protein K